MKRSSMLLAVALLISMSAGTLSAQRFVAGAGVSVGTIPRALEPLCRSARRLRGTGVAARAGVAARRFQVDATFDYIGRLGVRDAADCVFPDATSVDSSFAAAGNAAGSLALTGWVQLNSALRTGAEVGRVLGHSSWFVGPVVGAQAGSVRIEVAARRHVVSFDEVTRNYGSGTTQELSRRSASERAWGGMARILLSTQ